MLRNYSMLAQAGSPDPISTTVPSKNSSVASGLTPLTKEQLAQALQYMLTVCSYIGGNIHTVQNDTTFITQLHEAYVKSLNERFAALPQRARRPSDD
jgi:enamine deaminase RidA (YjgF/YER057c/UK114 family)